MKQRWNFRCYPTAEQEQVLARTFGCTRFVYNRFLDERTKAFHRGERMNYNQSSAALSELKRDPEFDWLNDVSCVPTQQALRHLQTAFRNFFDKRTGYPSFKRKDGKQSAEHTRSAFQFEVGNQRLIVAKLGRLKVKWSKQVPVVPTTVTIIKKPSGRYFVSLVVDVMPAPLPQTGDAVGIDFGISRLATLSNGERVANPKYSNQYQKRLKRQQQKLSRKKKGSNRYKRQKKRVARVHEKIANAREDTAKKLAWDMVSRFDTICVEDLNLRGLVKNHNLARSLSDASIGQCIRILETKAEMHGKEVVKIDRWFPSSKMCSACGALQEAMPLSIRHWRCDCGAEHDRDENAARNILAVGHTVTGRGANVSQC
jgi:putative transposase